MKKTLKIKMLFILLFLMPIAASAEQLTLDIWGLSYHIDRSYPYNETNFGWGLGYSLDDDLRVSAGSFQDSYRGESKYLGLEKMVSEHVGVLSFLMSRPSKDNGEVFIAVLPVVKLGVFNFLYMPRVDEVGLKESFAMYLTFTEELD